MLKPVNFMPENFGGYTLCMILTGMFLGYTTSRAWYFFLVSVLMFFIGMYFFSKDNKEQEIKEELK